MPSQAFTWKRARKMLLFFASLAIVISSCASKRSFILTGPKLYDKGTTETLTITFFDVKEKGVVNIRLLNSSAEGVLTEANVHVENDQTKVVKLPVPLEIPNYTSFGKLQVTGSIGDYDINRTVSIGFREPKILVFVNTDKPIYKAKQKVRIRVLLTDNYLRPPIQTKKGKIWITDPKKSRIMQWTNVSFAEGLIHREFTLIDEPVLGTWKIHVEIDNEKKYTKIFQVLEYVLPTFEVKVTPPSYVLENAKNTTWKICAKYTYGKPVRGELVTRLSLPDQHGFSASNIIENSTEIHGCKDVTLPVQELISGRSYFSRALKLRAEVIEDGTKNKINSTGSVVPTNEPYTISRENNDVKYFRPRIPLKITMSVKTPDSKPLPNETIKVCMDATTTKQSKIRTITEHLNVCKNYTSNAHGFVIFTIPPQDPSTVNIDIKVEAAKFDSNFLNRPKHSFKLGPWFSPSGNQLQLEKFPRIDCSAIGPDVKITQRFFYTFDEPGIRKIYYQIIARGELVKHGDFEVKLQADNRNLTDDTYLPKYPTGIRDGNEFHWDNDVKSSKYIGEFFHSMQLSHEMVPKARVLMYTVTSEGDVVADSTWYDIDPCFANKVEIKFGNEKQSPGSKTTIYVKAEPKSLCSIGIVDKSIYILDKGDRLSASQVSSQLGLFDTSSTTAPSQPTSNYLYCKNKEDSNSNYDSDYVDAISAFSSAGGIILTDLQLETRPCNKFHVYLRPTATRRTYGPGLRHRGGATTTIYPKTLTTQFGIQFKGNGLSAEISPREDLPSVTIRTDFPETWLFQLDRVGESGELVFKQDMPDSITEWQGDAVCIHSEKGLGFSKTASIIAFQPFFASLTLPYSVIRNETVPVIVSVFNYLKDCLSIKISLDQTEKFVLYNGTSIRNVCVCGEQSVTVRFHIKPEKVGQLNITVTAETSNEKDVCGNYDVATNVKKSDTITKPILVEAEGFLSEETINNFFCLREAEGGLFNTSHLLQLPSDVIQDSVRGYFTFTGNLMGPALEGLDRLVKLPTGCGEQNMIGLVPNIVVLDYLNATGRLTKKLKEKAIHNIQQGYVRQQKYKHPDGSYSAFGSRDKEGSMWLTAFVVRTFYSARRHINIDEKALEISKNWILSKQKDNGCFPLVGEVHNKAMKGGVAKYDETTSTLTAYILISMLESDSVNVSVVYGGFRCLEAKNNPSNYSLALFAYAASLANDPSAIIYLKQLIYVAEEEDASIFWKDSDKSIAIETAAYTVLALLNVNQDGDFEVAASIVKWLAMQRNPYGGFHSTQDTVVGLQALGVYGTLVTKNKLDMALSLKSNQIDRFFQLSKENELLVQRINLMLDEDEPENEINIEANGTGCALAQILVRYNLPNPESSKGFKLLVQTEKSNENCKMAEINICVSYNQENGSNMAIVEIKMISGYVPVRGTVEKLLQKTELDIRRFEIRENHVNLYFTSLTEKTRCFSFDVVQEIEVLDIKPSSVKVYDYYDNEKAVWVPYFIEETCSFP